MAKPEEFKLPSKPPIFEDIDETPEAKSGKIEGDEGDVEGEGGALTDDEGQVGPPVPGGEPPTPEPRPQLLAQPPTPKAPELVPTPALAPAPAAAQDAPPAAPPPPKNPDDYTTLAEAGMEGRGWPAEEETGTVTAPARVGAGTLAPLGGETAPLHERAEISVASPDNPEFARYIEQVSERGAFTGLGRADAPEILKQAFESRKRVAQGVIELYSSGKIAGDLGVPFGGKEIAPLVSAHIEKLSLEQPERVAAFNQLLTEAQELPRQIAGLQARKQKLASGEEVREATAQMDEKKKVLELAQASNKFWGGLKFWKGEGFGRLTWRKDLREARAKAKEMGHGRSAWLGGGISSGVGTRGRVGKELGGIGAELTRISTEKTADLAVTERLLQNAKKRLGALKLEVLGSGAMYEEAAEAVRKGIQTAFGKMLNPQEPSVEGYEAAEETLAALEKVVREGDAGTKRMDYLQRINPAEVRAALQKKSEGEAAKALRTLFLKTLENPHAPERLPTLIAALEPWLGRQKIGGKKDKLAAALFIREQIKHFHDTEIVRQDIGLQSRRASVAAGAARSEDEARLRVDETTLRTKDALIRALYAHISSLISERARREPPTPPETPPSTPPTPPRTPSVAPPETFSDSPFLPPKDGSASGGKGSTESASGGTSSAEAVPPETAPSAAETVDPLEQKFASVQTLEQLIQTLPVLSAVEFRGRTQSARDVISWLEEFDFFLEGGFFETRDPDIKRSYIVEDYLPDLDSIGNERQPELRAAVRRAVENLPIVKELGITLPLREGETPPAARESSPAATDFMEKVKGAVGRMGGKTEEGDITIPGKASSGGGKRSDLSPDLRSDLKEPQNNRKKRT